MNIEFHEELMNMYLRHAAQRRDKIIQYQHMLDNLLPFQAAANKKFESHRHSLYPIILEHSRNFNVLFFESLDKAEKERIRIEYLRLPLRTKIILYFKEQLDRIKSWSIFKSR